MYSQLPIYRGLIIWLVDQPGELIYNNLRKLLRHARNDINKIRMSGRERLNRESVSRTAKEQKDSMV